MSAPAATEKGLPTNLDAERFVLGSILLDDGLYIAAAGTLEPDDFSQIEQVASLPKRQTDGIVRISTLPSTTGS